MKGLRRILVWSLIPIVLEIMGLLLVDRFYLNDETSFNTKKIDIIGKKTPAKINVKVSDNAKNIGVSHNGNYISYYENGSIKVIDTSNNKKKEIKFENNAKLSSYKWLDEKDIMLIAEKYVDENGLSYLKFQSYNAKKDEKNILSNEKNKELKISLPDSKYEVSDIAVSSATNVTYVKVSKNGARSRLYRINVMANMEETKYVNSKLGKIATENKEDRLIYEDTTSNRIRVVGLKNPIATGENATHYLLNTDGEDKVYIGNGENKKIKKIFVTDVKNSRENWKTFNLSESVDKDDIYITRDGKIYINNSSKNLVTDIATGKEIKYTGNLIQVYNSGIISKNDGKIINNLF